jgi:glycosyltransferase involved in cell wall biosynthesis
MGSPGDAPISVAHIDTGSAFRGGQEALLNLAVALRKRGLRQHIVSPSGSVLSQRAQAAGLPVSATGDLRALRRLLRGFDVVHSHSGRAQNLAFCATVGMPVVRVASRHVAFEPNHPRIHRLKYSLTCHGIIAVSEAVRRTLLRTGISSDRIEVIPTGIGWPAELPGRTEARARWGFGEEDFVAGHLGAFTPEKGQDVAVEAARLLAARMPRLRMVLGGEGPLRAALANGPAILPGQVEDRSGFFAMLDVFLMPSRAEAWGLAALEAMAFGVPVIASNVGGLPEMIEQGATGWLIAPNQPAALADAIEQAAADPVALRAMGSRAREGARRFSLDETARRTEEFYQRLLRAAA